MTYYRRRHTALISLLLLVLAARALIPVGFMPAADGSAQLTLCPNGMLMPSDAGKGAGTHVDHCPFGSAPFAAPIAHIAITPVLAVAISIHRFDSSSAIPIIRAASAHQPRAPPA